MTEWRQARLLGGPLANQVIEVEVGAERWNVVVPELLPVWTPAEFAALTPAERMAGPLIAVYLLVRRPFPAQDTDGDGRPVLAFSHTYRM